jgi:hypothetical protein
MHRLFQYLQRIAHKPIAVIVFRLLQASVLALYHHCRLWPRLSLRAEQAVIGKTTFSPRLYLLATTINTASTSQRQALSSMATRVVNSDFQVFGHPVPKLEQCDFASDWRFNYIWQKQYFKHYQFYGQAQKQQPYDVKFPWELSRLHYLVPVLAAQLFEPPTNGTLQWVLSLLQHWRQQNPLAYSVNWYPMEASMRTIYLVMLLEITKLLQQRHHDTALIDSLRALACQCLVMLYEHAHFVWLNREYTDIRGNHFTANLVALQLASYVLGDEGLDSSQWGSYATRQLPKEVLLQFCQDGVNFEKACGYHKLVLELFMLATMAATRAEEPFPKSIHARLMRAAQFSDAIMRPDGVAAGFGDNDDALGLAFALEQPRSHGPVVELARAWFAADIGTYTFDQTEQWAARLLVGRVHPAPKRASNPVEHWHFATGGYVVVRNQQHGFFLMLDVGEVGMAGRGGHGHNDLLAFELCLDGTPVVIDPGCSGYTADLAKKRFFRSTAAHATVQLFGEEMARFAGHWAMHNDAIPHNVTVRTDNGRVIVQAAHSGYQWLHQGSQIQRQLEIDATNQSLTIEDRISTKQPQTTIHWHFPVGPISARNLDSNSVTLGCPQRPVICHSDTISLTTVKAPFSVGYGQESTGTVLSGTTEVATGQHHFSFHITVSNTEDFPSS